MAKVKKCIIWDLDDTLWNGVCLEGNVSLRQEVKDALLELDSRGILHSVASRGTESVALEFLKQFGLDELFLVPKINWRPKTQNIINIAKELGISLDSVAFVDDDIFELEQAVYMLPEILTFHADRAPDIPGMAIFNPSSTTLESKNRRKSYQAELNRKIEESKYPTREDFLLSCKMQLTIRPMKYEDVPRVLELMTRTHQLNTTGWILTNEELSEVLKNNQYKIVVAELVDKFGRYGIIGAAIVHIDKVWRLKYFALSCRVLGRGIELAFLSSVLSEAHRLGFEHGEAMFNYTGKNKMMRAFYQMNGFHKTSGDEQKMIFKRSLNNIPHIPRWLELL
jgi:FkbH-like protein